MAMPTTNSKAAKPAAAKPSDHAASVSNQEPKLLEAGVGRSRLAVSGAGFLVGIGSVEGAISGLPSAPHYKNLPPKKGCVKCLIEYLGIHKSLFEPNIHVTKLILTVVGGNR